MEVQLKTLTPLWTGGVDQTCDRLHETGLIGSLRWWYEAIVRGLGGNACDPTSEESQTRCEFDAQAYEKAKNEGRSTDEAIKAGLHSVCPVCYLFGTTSWARLFQLRAVAVPTTPLHFRTALPTNRSWLTRVFGGKTKNIDTLQVPYGDILLEFIPRRYDITYAKSQFALILRLAAEYGGIGARTQHGFGQFVFPPELNNISLVQGMQALQAKLQSGILRSNGHLIATPFSLENFVSLTFEVPKSALNEFTTERAHIGNTKNRGEERYIPCVFDLRYRSSTENWGFRQWLKKKGWKETRDPTKLEELDLLLGPRSQWGRGSAQKQIEDDQRTASRVFFGMPYQKEGDEEVYILRAWAFWLPELKDRLPNVQALKALLEEYIQLIFNNKARMISGVLGTALLSGATSGG